MNKVGFCFLCFLYVLVFSILDEVTNNQAVIAIFVIFSFNASLSKNW